MPRRPFRRPSPPSLVRRLTLVIVTVALLLATACSDAHTQAQRDLSDTGVDPNVVTLLNSPDLNPVLTALGRAFLTVRPDTSLVFLNQVKATSGKLNQIRSRQTNTQIIQGGATPSVWIDLADVLKPFAKDPRAQGAILPFATEPMVLAVKAGNPAHVTGLADFAAGGPSAGRCAATQPCGPSAYEWLKEAHVQPVFEVKVLNGAVLIDSIVAGRADAGLVYALTIPPGDADITTVPVASPPAPTHVLRMLSMSSNPTALQFERWVATSSQARSIITTFGLQPGNGAAT